ncbi:MAG: T9SS type A sorting domain-containing protein, partial [Bacteroidota bacterium]
RTSPTAEWTPSLKCTHEFDEYLNERRYIYENYENYNWKIMFGTLYNLFYEGLHLVEKIIQEWLGGGLKSGEGEWVNTEREVYSNFYNLGIENQPQASLRMNCYPVPAGDQLRVEITSINPGSKTLMLTNLTGQTIRTENINTLSSSLTWDISGIPAGIYIVRLYDQSAAVIVRKIIKQ